MSKYIGNKVSYRIHNKIRNCIPDEMIRPQIDTELWVGINNAYWNIIQLLKEKLWLNYE